MGQHINLGTYNITLASMEVSDKLAYPHNLTRSFDDCIHKVSYISAFVLLSLLNELGNSDKMLGLSSILWLFNKFNYTRAQMFESIYNMTFKIT